MFCSNCGAKNKEDAVFCIECGHKVGSTPTKSETAPATKKKSSIWRRLLKVVLGFILLIVGISIIGFAYQWYKDLPREMDTLGSISLGMKPVDVTLELGKPNDERINDEGEKGYIYNGYSGIDYIIVFDENDKVRRICSENSYREVMGLGKYDSEERIVNKLGKPSNTSVNAEGTRKFISYAKYNVTFEIEQGDARLVCVTTTEMSYTDEYQ
ncbi:zinc-ribbon domain-containing protein [Candidatus Nomurabacteria bacterium]|nr:zinc-ribbon domain-containing protein [Candidatus Nomurabacteria bacterium]MCB9818012.1 zinc-ribbon domain-containing protein [Candidatus Nomurabacteria bacterium]